MTRRDTIIIAVLVNAALLMILFATALRSDHSDKKSNNLNRDSKVEQLASQKPLESPVEDMLNEFVTSVPSLAENTSGETIFTFDDSALAFSVPSNEIVSPLETPKSVEETRIPLSNGEEQFVNITVKKGDFLEKIAKSNNTTITAIMKANNLASSQLKIGQVLRVPLKDKTKIQQKGSPQTNSHPQPTEFYVVKEGDNPWLIASRNKINLDELLRINGLDEQKAKRLRPGDKLKIR